MSWRATILTLFPGMFPGPLGQSLAGRALESGLWSLDTRDIRDFAPGRHRNVDDTPFGGWRRHGDAAGRGGCRDRGRRRWPAAALCQPRAGRHLSQDDARRLAEGPGLVVLCGRYEGIDQRVIDARAAQEISVGDYVLSGGELAAMVVLDACIRLLPGVMGAAESAEEESFSNGLLEYPHYTRPADWQGRCVPDILLSGDHAKIAAWRHAEAEAITRARRPDLWHAYRTRHDTKGLPS